MGDRRDRRVSSSCHTPRTARRVAEEAARSAEETVTGIERPKSNSSGEVQGDEQTGAAHGAAIGISWNIHSDEHITWKCQTSCS